ELEPEAGGPDGPERAEGAAGSGGDGVHGAAGSRGDGVHGAAGAGGDGVQGAAGGRPYPAGPGVHGGLERMALATARLSALLADLLTLARADEGAPLADDPVDVEELLVAVYREIRPLAGTVRLRLDVDDAADGAPVVRGDAERLRQMLLNLAA